MARARKVDLLDDEIVVSLECGPVGNVGQGDDEVLGDDQLRGLGTFGGAGSFSIGSGRIGRRRFEAAGSDHGAGFEALESSDFVFELLEAFLLAPDDFE